jgi:curved DNA-binding protein CbpA
MDPYDVLGIRPGSPEPEIAAAYRDAAKRWHPDVAGSEGEERMAEINAAYDLVRAAAQNELPAARPATPKRPGRRGDWLLPALRRALGPELLDMLNPHEDVKLVTPTSTWASPRALLAVTDRRLLWLLDDAVGNRVRSLRFRDTAHAEPQLAWPRRTRARLSVEPRFGGKRWTFSDLRPATAQAIAGHVRAGLPPARAQPRRGPG